ncbi:hypothetical protein HK104_000063 [Borealophlyctis nickersoniae]|nr:hypothetical protein HK104_000063 [Borealophlyctis nickersoniae]
MVQALCHGRFYSINTVCAMTITLKIDYAAFLFRVFSWFFGAGQVIPIVRGDGIYQPAMDLALEKLNLNRWVHIFPEGKVHQGDAILPFKWGVARLIMESKTPPIVIPWLHESGGSVRFIHRHITRHLTIALIIGMETVLPEGAAAYIPKLFQRIHIAVGDPIDFAQNGVLEEIRREGLDDAAARIRITNVIRAATLKLRQRMRSGDLGEKTE